jgi:hypothetical protein
LQRQREPAGDQVVLALIEIAIVNLESAKADLHAEEKE